MSGCGGIARLKTAAVSAAWLPALDAYDSPTGVHLNLDITKVGGNPHPILSDGDKIVSIEGSRFNRAFGAKNKLDAAIEALKIPDIIPDLPVDSPDEDEFASGLFVDEEES